MTPARPCQLRPPLRSVAIVLLFLVAAATLSGCGQKGQLYLPSQKKTKVPPATTPAPAVPPAATPPAAPAPSATTPRPS